MTYEMVPGTVLAAGRSSRMGRSKALLPCGSGTVDTFLVRIMSSMRAGGIEDILVVGRPDDADLQDAVARTDLPVRFVANPDHERGQLTSIVAAVNTIDCPGVRGLLVMPVDMPLVQPATFAAVLRASAKHPGVIVRAVCGGRHGHPVIFDRACFDGLRRADPAVGAKVVLHVHPVLDVDVPDTGVLKDVDSVEDYVALFGRTPDSPASGVPS
jgi:molybdenum cofactor cytidylyltransferase